MGSASGNRVLLVYPASEADRMSVLPLSLLYIAQPLIELGVQVEVLDQRYDGRFYENLDLELRREPLCVGISCITGPQIVQVRSICEFVRKRTGAAIVLGGPHATLLPEQTLRSGLFDYVVTGRGEAPFLALVGALMEGRTAGPMPQVGYIREGEVVLDKGLLPEPRVRKVPYQLIAKYGRHPVVPVVTSFGCPHSCSFCVEKVFHPRYREVPFEDVVLMLEDALNLSPDLVNFLDDNFLAGRKTMLDLMSACDEKGVHFEWICTGRIDEILRMGKDVLAFARRRGLVGIFFGIESGSERILRLINKGITPEMVQTANAMLKDARIRPHYSFMAGFPTETVQDMDMTARLMGALKRRNPDAIIWKINQYTPYPGTPLYDLAVREGFRPPERFEEWSHVHFYAQDYRLPYDNRY